MSSVGATRRLAHKPPNSTVLTNVNIENTLPDPLNLHSPAEELLPLSLQVEQTLTLANKPPSNSTVLTNVNIENTLPDPLNPHSPAEELLPLSLQVGQVMRQSLFIHVRSPSWNPLAPFINAYEYKLARFFHQSKTSMKQIDQFFKDEV